MVRSKTLWTVKNKKELSLLKSQGFLEANFKISTDFWEGDFTPAYLWMNDQMKKKISTYQKDLPLWAWTKRPDFRSYRVNIPKGESAFLIEFNKNPQEILISDFQNWHCVLNGYPFFSEKEESSLEKKYGTFFIDYWNNVYNFEKETPKNIKKMVEKSWQNIFKNVEHGQATFGRLNISEVFSIKEYKR